MNISAISVGEDNNLRRNMFIKYSNKFMSFMGNENNPIEKAHKIESPESKKLDKSMGIETLTIFPKQVIDGKTIITA